jgi:CRISPR-associated endoribonuclease Cas6/Csy4 subtype I-F
MDKLFYVDFRVTGEDSNFTLSRLVAAIHGFDTKAAPEERLAMAFPAMRAAFVDERGVQHTPPSSGELLRVFGSQDALEQFVATGTPLKLVRLGAAVRTVIAPVPVGAGKTRFVRDRAFEKGFASGSYARRQQQRATEQNRPYVARTNKGRPSRSFSFETQSQSTGMGFFLDIRNEVAEDCVLLSNVTSYGLCGPGSAVPLF